MRFPIFQVPNAAVALVLVPLIVTGCSSGGGPTAPPAPAPTLTLRQALNASLPATVTVPANLDTTASLLVTLHMPDDLKAAGAVFLSGGRLVDAGSVWIHTFKVSGEIDSVQLMQTSATVGGNALLLYSTLAGTPGGPPPPPVRIAFDGIANHVFRVVGSIVVTGFVDSVQSVDDLNVSAPAAAAAVPRSSPLTVSWSDPGSDASVKVSATVISDADTTNKSAFAVVDDPTGTAVIPAVLLGGLPAGSARLAVTRYRLVYKIAGGKSVGFACESIDVRAITLN